MQIRSYVILENVVDTSAPKQASTDSDTIVMLYLPYFPTSCENAELTSKLMGAELVIG